MREVKILSKIGDFIKKKKSTILGLLGSIGMLLLAGLTGVFVAVYQTYSPEKYMNEYYECFKNESYGAMFASSGIKESSFITADTFAQMMINSYGYEEDDKYSISDVSKNGKYAKATVSFTDSETNEEINWDLKLQKGSQKHYMFLRTGLLILRTLL